jgi:hypothetical protein
VAVIGISVPARRFESEQKNLVRVLRELSSEATAELGTVTAAPRLAPPGASAANQ